MLPTRCSMVGGMLRGSCLASSAPSRSGGTQYVVRHTHTHTHTCTCTHAHTHTRTHARTHAHTHARTRTHTHTHMHTHMRTHTHTHTHTRECAMYALSPSTGLYSQNRCPKGKHCNFLHVFRNPGGAFSRADRDLPPLSPPLSRRSSRSQVYC